MILEEPLEDFSLGADQIQGNLVIRSIAFADWLARLALALAALAAVTSCGGGVSGPAPVNDPTRITILPATATVYSGLPTTFVISGGTGSYIASSSNQAIIQVSGSVSGSLLTVTPNPVLADTTVTLTVRDTGTTPVVTATVTVKPGTIANDITITPSSTQGNCPTGTLCSGGDAVVTATLSQGGIPLPARGVRYDVVSGDFRYITSPPGATTETLDTTITVITDERGKATVRIRASADAANQTAILQVTDLGTGAFQRVGFVIAQATGASPGFFVTPSSATFQGARSDQCAGSVDGNGREVSATFYIFGGIAPYTVSSTSSAFIVTNTFVPSSGGSFKVYPTGQCADNAPIIVRDASGRTTTVTVSNVRGTDAVPPLVVSPDEVSLSSCSSVATVTAAGGTGHYTASSGSGSVVVSDVGNGSFSIRRNPSSPAETSPVNVGISDGVSSVNVTVNLTGPGAGQCPTPGFTANPNNVTLTNCTGVAQVTLSGGSGTYNAASNNTSVTASVTGNILSIQRANPSPPFTPPATVNATDGFSNIPITVNATVTGSGTCP
jgi:hypothetical protein